VLQCVSVCCSVLQFVADDLTRRASHNARSMVQPTSFISFKSSSMIEISRSLLPRSLEKRPMRLRLEIEIE